MALQGRPTLSREFPRGTPVNLRLTFLNREAERITGYSHTEVPSLTDYVLKLYGSVHYEVVMARKRHALRDGIEERNLISLITSKNGTKKLISWNSATVLDDDG